MRVHKLANRNASIDPGNGLPDTRGQGRRGRPTLELDLPEAAAFAVEFKAQYVGTGQVEKAGMWGSLTRAAVSAYSQLSVTVPRKSLFFSQ